MSQLYEWHTFDPNDISTHPEGDCLVQVRYANGIQTDEAYSRELGLFCRACVLPEATLGLEKQWRYVTPRGSLGNITECGFEPSHWRPSRPAAA